MRTLFAISALGLLSCTHLRPEDRTVAEHRNDAVVHELRARDERALYDPSDVRRSAPRLPGSQPFGGAAGTYGTWNPSAEHLTAADQELRQASAHLAAADTLVAFEAEACRGMSRAERSSCPLFASTVSAVSETGPGFILTFKAGVDVAQTHRRLSCHLAFAEATGFDRPSCPLFLEGTTLEADGSTGIAFKGRTDVVAAALRTQVRRLFLWTPTVR